MSNYADVGSPPHARHVLSFRFTRWSGFPDLFLNLLPEKMQAHIIAKRMWPGVRPSTDAYYVLMPGACYRALPDGGVREASRDERDEAVRGAPAF